MGNICNGNHEKQTHSETNDTLNKNFSVVRFVIKKLCTVEIVLGTYRCHRGDTLLVISHEEYLQYSTELRDYSQNFSSLVDMVNSERKKIMNVAVNRACPYKKIQLCILSSYDSNESEAYLQQFRTIVQQIVNSSSDLTLQINHTAQKTNGLPNQTLLGIFFKYINQNLKKPLKITMISSQNKLLNLVRYQIVKLQNFVILGPIDKNRN